MDISRPRLYLSFLVLFAFFFVSQAGVSDILIRVKKTQIDDPYRCLDDWPTAVGDHSSPCNWTGIGCDLKTLGVTSINLAGFNISSSFPADFCRIRTLRILILAVNDFNGSISADSISACSHLHHLDLSYNNFVGDLPEFSPGFANLRTLNLSFNNFTGGIPESFGCFRALETLSLYSNFFSGSIPAFLGNLTELRRFELGYNTFTGPLPPEIGNLTQLENMWLARAGITGEIPHSIGNLVSLLNFDVSTNFLSGEIPPTLGNLRSIWQIELYTNNLSGELPESLGNLTTLRNFDASENNLTGKIPEKVAGLPLSSFMAYQNNLEGSIPESIASNPNLVQLKLFENRLSGELPRSLGMSSALAEIDVSGNGLIGELPHNLCQGKKLQSLMTLQNKISGKIPESYAQCVTLAYVRISFNALSGVVPKNFWGLPRLQILQLEGNRLQGSIPPEIGRARGALQKLLIADNLFSGPLPDEMCRLYQLIIIDASRNNFSGVIPPCLGQVRNLQKLVLQGNMFSGEMPDAVSSWTALVELNLCKNKISGHIPPLLGNLSALVSLDLSENSISGDIPVELTKLKANHFNFSFNKLAGRVPAGFNDKLFIKSLIGNPKLCGSNLDPIPPCGRNSKPAIFIAILAVAAVLLLALILWLVTHRIKISRAKANFLWTVATFHQQLIGFTEDEIFKSLTEENLVGTGGSGNVYRVMLRSGQTVAVKKLQMGNDPDQELEIEKFFRLEAKMLGNVRHGNIVRLLCSGSSQDVRVLVYEYMQSGSLGDVLHGNQGEGDGLLLADWRTRLAVAIGAAQGLAYLHHDCVPPIVHRDVKANNILLDEELRPRLADFGLAKTLRREAAGHGESSVSRIAGSYGYIAPEYGYTTRVNEKSDVYSFGVVLMELVTGKSPNDPFFHMSNTDMVKWVMAAALSPPAWPNNNYEGGHSYSNLDRILDQQMDRSTCNYEEIKKALDVALQCTAVYPTDRPPMRTVVELLKACSLARPR